MFLSLTKVLCLFLLTPFIIPVLWGGCARERPSTKPAILAMVNGEAITIDEFNVAFKAIITEEGPQTHSGDLKTSHKDILDQLIEKKVLLQEAKHKGIQVSEEEVRMAIHQMQGDYPETEFNELLKSSGLTPERWKLDVTENLLIDKLIENTITRKLKVSEEEIKSYYQKHRAEFEKKEEVRARQIVVATEGEAKTLHQQLLAGANFIELATEKSVSPDRTNGGDLGYFTKGQMPEEFDIVFTLKSNTISPIVKSPYGYHIFKVEVRRAPRFQSLAEVQGTIHQQLMNDQEDRLRTQWIKELKSKADIQVNSTLLLRQDETKNE